MIETEYYLISLKARRDRASDFVLNQSMHVEIRLLDAQIEAIEKHIESQNIIRSQLVKIVDAFVFEDILSLEKEVEKAQEILNQ